MRLPALLLALGLVATTSAANTTATLGAYPFVGKWRGMHGHAVGLCTAELVAKDWVMTAGHCATRMLKHEEVHVQITFEHGGDVKRGVTRCVHSPGEDLALCKIKVPVNAFKPAKLNSDLYKATNNKGGSVTCVGTYGGLHVTGPKRLEVTASGATLKVDNSKGSGMHAGDSGGAWLRRVPNTTSGWALTGIIHGGEGKGAKRRGVAVQPSYLRAWVNKITNSSVEWVAVNRKNDSVVGVGW